MQHPKHHIADAKAGNWVDSKAPKNLRPYLHLARFDRPVGFWLLAIPCWAGMALARLDQNWQWMDILLALAFGVGAIAMRGAGCTWNDLLDRDLDAKVERTAKRPLAAGTLQSAHAIRFLAVQLAVGLLVLLLLPLPAQIIALCALPLAALYPLMKRITWWPQAWLGLTFNWGVLVGFAAITGELGFVSIAYFAGFAFWTLGYDTIYALQDKEDDALIGVKSTARLFGRHSKTAVGIIYFLALALLMFSAWSHADTLPQELQRQAHYGVLLATGLLAMNLSTQAFQTNFSDSEKCLAAFKSNSRAGLEYVLLLALAPTGLSLLMQLNANG